MITDDDGNLNPSEPLQPRDHLEKEIYPQLLVLLRGVAMPIMTHTQLRRLDT
jgi:hypothetical protein